MSHFGKQPHEQDDHDRGIRNEERLCGIDRQWIAHMEIHAKDAVALNLQLTETLRRLTELNHAHEQAREKEHDFVSKESHLSSARELKDTLGRVETLARQALPREVFDSTQKEMVLRAEALALTVSGKPSAEEHDGVAARVKLIEDWKNRATGAAVILTLIAGVIGAVIVKAFGG